jgi:hypothetical protein
MLFERKKEYKNKFYFMMGLNQESASDLSFMLTRNFLL